MKSFLPIAIFTVTLLGVSHTATAQRYQAGDIVEDFILIDRSTGEEVNLYDMEGKVIFLEWFAYWCPFCQLAADDIGPGIVDFYARQNGTAQDIDFIHVGVNLQGGAEVSTQQFVDRYGFELVLNDFSAAVGLRFGDPQPIFAIINGVKNSSTHDQWELLFANSGFGNIGAPIQTFRRSIDSVVSVTELANISTRGRVGLGDEILIGGFVVEGDEDQTVLIQGVGPELIDLDPTDNLTSETTLANPFIVLNDVNGNQIAVNIDWESEDAVAKANAMRSTGANILAPGSRSAAILADLSPGAYTVLVGGVSNTEGIALVEAYEVNATTKANRVRLINISTRGNVGTVDNILIGGFVIEGTSPREILIQGVGNELAEVSDSDSLTNENTLADPFLILFNSENVQVAANDNWQDDNPAAKADAMAAAGSFDLEPSGKSAAILTTLEPGRYTVFLLGATGGEGIALIEAYELD